MTIEQKARAYDEALERARKIHNEQKAQPFDVMLKVFPKLKENEDDEIRKALINVFATHKNYEVFFGVSVEDIIAWLEKQGECHMFCSEEQMKVLDEILTFAANHESPYWNNYIFGTLCNLIRQLKGIKL